MAHFALVNDSNIVENVIVVANEDCLDSEGNESEAVGQQFIANELGLSGTWVQTSYNTIANIHRGEGGGTPFRYNYAMKGSTWDEENNAFISPKPYPSWVLDSDFDWQPPVTRPDPFQHEWDEDAYQADTADPKTAGWVDIG